MPVPAWEKRWPGRLKYELRALRHAGIPYRIDREAWRAAVVVLHLQLEVAGRRFGARAIFPARYPHFRVHVEADDLALTHHQNPLNGTLCLLGRGEELWQPDRTLARLLTEQLPAVIAAGSVDASPADIAREERQAEPFSAYYAYRPDTAVLVDGRWRIPETVRGGTLVLGIAEAALASPILRGAVLEVRGPDGRPLEHAPIDPVWSELYPKRREIPWRRLDASPRSLNPNQALAQVPGQRSALSGGWSVSGGRLRSIALLTPEEVDWRDGGDGDGWLFVASLETQSTGRGKRTAPPRTLQHTYYARAVYAGPDDLALRIPAAARMRTATVSVVGLGSLGAPAVLELARVGTGELRLLDGDFADAGPSVRWPFGLLAVGRAKTEILREFIRAHYPYTRVSQALEHTLGAPPGAFPVGDDEALDLLLDGTSLLFDASANVDVQRLLAGEALERGIPYVSVVARPGGWGGLVFRHLPGVTRGCWQCLQEARADGAVPAPAEDEAKGVQPRGCGDPTFTGTGFDMSTLALDAVRRAVGTLCGPSGGYPDGDWDVAVISLRAPHGGAIPPHWEVMSLERHPECQCCG